MQETAGFLGGLVRQARLAWRLFRDSRVPTWVKLVPLAGVLYFLSPVDLIPDFMLPGLGEVDDIVILFLAAKLFVDLAPPGVVRQHLDEMMGVVSQEQATDASSSETYIDVPYRVLDPNEE